MIIEEIFSRIKDRKPDSHKGDYGHVFVLAGSCGYTGAPYLASQGALLSGSGLVTLGVARSIYPIMAGKLTEVMVRPFPETDSLSLSLSAEKEIIKFAEKVDVLVLGPGLSLDGQTQKLVRNLLLKVSKPLVVDADGVTALANHLDVILKKIEAPVVLTPHPGEMARLVKEDAGAIQERRREIALDFSKKYNVTTVLKGHATVVAGSKGEVYVNTTGNPGMASGGVGDILTGMIASLIGQGLESYSASILGTYVHGLAGDLAAKERGELSLSATDLLNKLPEAFKSLA